MDDTYEFFSRFVFEHLEKDRKYYESFSRNEFLDDFKVDDILFDEFIQFVLNRKIKLDFYAQENRIKDYLKANIAEQLFSPNVAAQIKGNHDRMLQKVKALDSENLYKVEIGALNLDR